MGRRSSKARKRHSRNTRAMAMAIFSANPKSFKLRRYSTMASDLKSAVSVKLAEFISELTDDVFTEYITILVCNGKNQYQAREDLDAFLGERTEEFVSWLWTHLLDFVSTRGAEISLKNHIGGSDSSFQADDRDDDTRIRRRIHGSKLDGGLLRSRNITSSEALAHDSTYECSRVISSYKDQFAPRAKKPKQNLDRKLSLALGDISLYSTRDPVVSCPQSSVLDYACARNNCVDKVFRRSVSLSLEDKLLTHYENRRVSVWDRLGRPSDNISTEGEKVHLHDVEFKKQNEVVHDERRFVASGLDCEASRDEKSSVAHSYRDDGETPQNCATGTVDVHPANSFKRKRLFGEASDTQSIGSVPAKDMKKSKSPVKEISLSTPPSLAFKMLDMKQRLQKMETEMSMLKSKQVKKENGGKLSQMENSSELKFSGDDVDSRTIFVTNVISTHTLVAHKIDVHNLTAVKNSSVSAPCHVHFAATKAALSSFFAKCGIVVNVVKMVDPVTAKPQGSAYVTFAGKDSVEAALALSGTALLSRIIKVSRKSEVVVAASVPTHFNEKPSHIKTPSCYINSVPNKPYHYSASRLQWRRETSVVTTHL